MGWKNVVLESIIDVRDGTHDSPKYVSDGYPLITSKNIVNGKLDFSTVSLISENDYLKINRRSKVNIGDIIMPMIGTIGNPHLIIKEPIFAIKNVALFKKNDRCLISKFLYYLLISSIVEQQLSNESRGGTQKFVSLKNLRQLKIPLPPLETQKRIVDILDKAQELIDKRKEQMALMDELIQSLFYDMFGDPLNNSNKFDIEKLENLCRFITKGTTPNKSDIFETYKLGLVPFLKVYHIADNGGIDFTYKPSFISEDTHSGILKRSKVFNGDVLMNIVGPPLGKICLVSDQYNEWNINQAIAIFRSKEKLNPRYLLWTLKSRNFLNSIISQAIGIRQQNISLQQCRDIKIPLPPLDLQNQFAERVQKIEEQKKKMEISLSEMEDNFNSLMQRAFKGEI